MYNLTNGQITLIGVKLYQVEVIVTKRSNLEPLSVQYTQL